MHTSKKKITYVYFCPWFIISDYVWFDYYNSIVNKFNNVYVWHFDRNVLIFSVTLNTISYSKLYNFSKWLKNV